MKKGIFMFAPCINDKHFIILIVYTIYTEWAKSRYTVYSIATSVYLLLGHSVR